MQHETDALENFEAATAAALISVAHDAPPPPFFKTLLIARQRLQQEKEGSEAVWGIVCGRLLLDGINELAESQPRWAEILKGHYIDRLTMRGMAYTLGYDNRYQVDREQRKAIVALANILLEWERNARRQQTARLLDGLRKPPTCDVLFGAEEKIARLQEALLAPDHPWLIVVAGLGGLGKTAVADQTIRQLVPSLRFHKIISLYLESGDAPLSNLLAALGREMGLPASNQADTERQIAQTLNANPCLVFLDGFEKDISHLADGLGKLANPSKFIITSRSCPAASDAFFVQPLTSLSATAAAGLVRQYAHKIGRLELAAASEEQIGAIHRRVGGNPLALKLIVGLSNKHTIPAILADLTELKVEENIEEMYRRIYWKAWRALSAESQAVLKVMQSPDSTDGVSLDFIASLCPDLELRVVSAAVADLINHSLLETHGSAWDDQMRYRIHILTKSFLQTEIIHYPQDFL